MMAMGTYSSRMVECLRRERIVSQQWLTLTQFTGQYLNSTLAFIQNVSEVELAGNLSLCL